MKGIYKVLIVMLIILLVIPACQEDSSDVVHDTTPYTLDYGHLAEPKIPADNALTEAGVRLGKMLFYEPMLSKDGSQSCASCHQQTDGFSDKERFSIGVEGLPGKRQAMPIFNMAWHSNEFFWDGRAHLLRDQSLLPIQDPLEMNETLENVLTKLSTEQSYKDQFVRAFGSEDITAEKMSLAMEQFMLSIVSNQSKYDQYLLGKASLSESEARGLSLFEAEYNPFFPELSGADCAHCHGGLNFENDLYMNNGLDDDNSITDKGREMVTMNPQDRAKFKVPSLRNVAVTAPYMHDGRFETLDQVIDHYNEQIKMSNSIDPALLQVINNGGLLLDEQDKLDIIAFLNTLTDSDYLENPAYKSPF